MNVRSILMHIVIGAALAHAAANASRAAEPRACTVCPVEQTACPETYVVYPEASHVQYPDGRCVFGDIHPFAE
jgi:hypothetical protein